MRVLISTVCAMFIAGCLVLLFGCAAPAWHDQCVTEATWQAYAAAVRAQDSARFDERQRDAIRRAHLGQP